jgi:DNA-binding Lrp family transcriptional regulator
MLPLITWFINYIIIGMFPIPLNKFEKEKRVIALHSSEGKTIREISKEVHMSFRDISRIIKTYEKKIKIQQTKKENNQQPTIKNLSLSSRAFILFQEGKKIDEVKILLDIPFKKAMQFWVQYLKSIRMFESFEFYQEHGYDIPTFLSIKTYMDTNKVSGNDILQVLRAATDIINLRAEIERLKQIKNNYSLNQNTNYKPLLPLGRPEHHYRY